MKEILIMSLPENIQKISATKIRKTMREKGDLK